MRPSAARFGLIGVLLGATVLAGGCVDQGERPSPAPRPPVPGAENPQQHYDAWARLLWAAHKLDAAARDTRLLSGGTFAFAETPKQAARRTGFAVSGVSISEYEGDETSFRYCLITPSGEFYAGTHTKSEAPTANPVTGMAETKTLGVGECSYETGVIHLDEEGRLQGGDDLERVGARYRAIVRRGGLEVSSDSR